MIRYHCRLLPMNHHQQRYVPQIKTDKIRKQPGMPLHNNSYFLKNRALLLLGKSIRLREMPERFLFRIERVFLDFVKHMLLASVLEQVTH